MNIYLFSGSKRLTENFNPNLSQKAHKDLTSLDVNVRLGSRVIDYNGERITYDDNKIIDLSTVIWASGVVANSFKGIKDNIIGRGGRIKVDKCNMVIGIDCMFAIGDIAIMEDEPLWQVAQVAIQQSENLARNINLLRIRKKNNRI